MASTLKLSPGIAGPQTLNLGQEGKKIRTMSEIPHILR